VLGFPQACIEYLYMQQALGLCRPLAQQTYSQAEPITFWEVVFIFIVLDNS